MEIAPCGIDGTEFTTYEIPGATCEAASPDGNNIRKVHDKLCEAYRKGDICPEGYTLKIPAEGTGQGSTAPITYPPPHRI